MYLRLSAAWSELILGAPCFFPWHFTCSGASVPHFHDWHSSSLFSLGPPHPFFCPVSQWVTLPRPVQLDCCFLHRQWPGSQLRPHFSAAPSFLALQHQKKVPEMLFSAWNLSMAPRSFRRALGRRLPGLWPGQGALPPPPPLGKWQFFRL